MPPDRPDPTSTALVAWPASFATTVASLHLVAARVLAAARYDAVGRLGLVVTDGGFATPEFDGRQLAVVDGMLGDGGRRQPITTLADAYDFAGLDPETPLHPVLDLPADPTAPLPLDRAAVGAHARWLSFSQALLDALVADTDDSDDTGATTLWPEHFDLALESGPAGARANYGASPGDDAIAEPYLYVGPHDPRSGPFWNAGFGAALPYTAIRSGEDPLAFLRRGRELVRSS